MRVAHVQTPLLAGSLLMRWLHAEQQASGGLQGLRHMPGHHISPGTAVSRPSQLVHICGCSQSTCNPCHV